jgi:hypothetical protein
MDPRVEEPRSVGASLLEQVGQVAVALTKAVEAASAVPNHLRADLRATCEGVPRRIEEARLTIGLVGDPGVGRRTLVNALLGERVLPTNTPRRGATVTLVRNAPSVEFSALSVDGRSVASLSRKMPDRHGLFEKSTGQIDREVAAAEELSSRLQTARQRAASLELAPQPHAFSFRAAGLWVALWSWLIRLLLRFSWVKRLSSAERLGDQHHTTAQSAPAPATLPEERAAIAAMERELAGMRTVDQVAAHRERLRIEREKYEEERRAVFLSQVRDFDGTDIGERIVDYPAKRLPDRLTLMDVPCPSGAGAAVAEKTRNRVAREADALVVVADMARPPSEAVASLVSALGGQVPVLLVVLTKAERSLQGGPDGTSDAATEALRRQALDRTLMALGADVRRIPGVLVAAEAVLDGRPESAAMADRFRATTDVLWSRFEDTRLFVIAWREALRMHAGVSSLSRAQAREEELSRKRLSGLESNRIPDPAVFREELLGRLDAGIEAGADRVLASALAGLRVAVERLRSEWKERITSASARTDVDACIAHVNETAAARIAAVLEETAEIVARELHDVTETLQAWAVEGIHTHYRLMRRLGAEGLAPVASELTREDLERELLTAQPFDGAREAFEKQRVGFGLRGAAAGAALGTLIAPGIGTAVGAVLGVFAGLLKGTDSLKQECIAKIDASLDETERHARAQLQGKRGDLSRIIRVALGEALEEAFVRLSDAIARLMAVERKALDRERARLSELTEGRDALDACEERLARIVARAASAECPIGAASDQGWQSVRPAPRGERR